MGWRPAGRHLPLIASELVAGELVAGEVAAPMTVVYDRSITVARIRVNAHRPAAGSTEPRCGAGCGHWPCRSFLAAFALITRNANGRALR